MRSMAKHMGTWQVLCSAVSGSFDSVAAGSGSSYRGSADFGSENSGSAGSVSSVTGSAGSGSSDSFFQQVLILLIVNQLVLMVTLDVNLVKMLLVPFHMAPLLRLVIQMVLLVGF